MREMKKVSLFVVLTLVGALGLAACGDNPPASTPVPTAVATKAPTTAVQQPTTEPTAAEVATTAPTAVMEATTAPTAMEVATTEPTAMVGGSTPTTGGGGGGMTVTGPAADVLTKYFQAMKGLQSYHYTILTEVSGISSTTEGDFQAPNLSRTTTDLGALGKSESIVIGLDSYTKSPGQETYVHTVVPNIPQGMDLSPYITSAELVGDETVDGVATTHVKFSYDTDKMMADLMTQMGQTGTQLPSMGISQSELWVDKSTNYPVKQTNMVTISVAGTSMSTTSTQTFSKFNEPVSPPIEKPTNFTEAPEIPTVEIPEIPTIEIPTIVVP